MGSNEFQSPSGFEFATLTDDGLIQWATASSPSYGVKCPGAAAADNMMEAISQHLSASPQTNSERQVVNATATNVFDKKIDKSSSELYFRYYGSVMHQQNMLQDYTRTGTYYSAIVENPSDFAGLAVMDVGAGSGVLSLFAAQAGARKVYAVEASDMSRLARLLADCNPTLGERIEVVHSKVEEAQIPEKVDVLVSEPMGTLLVNERMLETYIYARDHFLKPGGKMFPAEAWASHQSGVQLVNYGRKSLGRGRTLASGLCWSKDSNNEQEYLAVGLGRDWDWD
eukprot:gene2418-8735_t